MKSLPTAAVICLVLLGCGIGCRPKDDPRPPVSPPKAGTEESAAKGADNPSSNSDPPVDAEPHDQPPPPSVKLTLAQGLSPAQLLSFMGEADSELRLTQLEPQRFASLQEQKDAQKHIVRLKLEAADQLLAHPQVTPAQSQAAKRARLQALSGLSHFRDLKALQALEAMAASLAEDPDVRLAADAANVTLGLTLEQLQAGQLADPTEVVTRIERLTKQPDALELADLFNCQQALALLTRYGYVAAAQQARSIVLKAFADNPNPLIQQEIAVLQTSTRFDALNDLLRQALAAAPPAIAAAGSADRERLDFGPAVDRLITDYPDEETLDFLANAALGLENGGRESLAIKLLEAGETAFAKTESAVLAGDVRQLAADARRRAKLIGQTFTPTGLFPNGAPLDWSVYRGRPTIIAFWSPRRSNAVSSLQQIKDQLPIWGRGRVQVLGIVLDAPGTELGNFLAEANLPWDSLFNRDSGVPGWREPNAAEAGVGGLPFFLLLDAEGKVVAKAYEVAALAESVQSLIKTPAATN
jgi:hypothetical protein